MKIDEGWVLDNSTGADEQRFGSKEERGLQQQVCGLDLHVLLEREAGEAPQLALGPERRRASWPEACNGPGLTRRSSDESNDLTGTDGGSPEILVVCVGEVSTLTIHDVEGNDDDLMP